MTYYEVMMVLTIAVLIAFITAIVQYCVKSIKKLRTKTIPAYFAAMRERYPDWFAFRVRLALDGHTRLQLDTNAHDNDVDFLNGTRANIDALRAEYKITPVVDSDKRPLSYNAGEEEAAFWEEYKANNPETAEKIEDRCRGILVARVNANIAYTDILIQQQMQSMESKPKSAAGSMVKGAVVGGIIAGPAGAVVGAMVGKEKHDAKEK